MTIKSNIRRLFLRLILPAALLFFLVPAPERVKAGNLSGKWLFIGDSYFASTGKPKLPDLIADGLGVPAKSRIMKCRTGYGVIRRDRQFISLIRKMPVDNSVTNVLIFGGIYNDRGCPRAKTEKAFSDLIKMIRKKCPKAVIWYTAGNWHVNWIRPKGKAIAQEYQNRILTRLPYYRSACRAAKVRFLEKPVYALRAKNNKDLFAKDGHHPSLKGRKKLAAAIISSIKKYK